MAEHAWRVVEGTHRLDIVGGPGGGTVCIGSTALSFKPHRRGSHRGEKMVYRPFSADDVLKARLLAAAPELLDALRYVQRELAQIIPGACNDVVDAAIAKAEGR